MTDETLILLNHVGKPVRLTQERLVHLLEHPEMVGQIERVSETLAAPILIVTTITDETVHVYHRFYEQTPVTRKFLQVVVKYLENDAYILTAFYTNRAKKGKIIWQA